MGRLSDRAVSVNVSEAASGQSGIIAAGGNQTLSPNLTLEGDLTLSSAAPELNLQRTGTGATDWRQFVESTSDYVVRNDTASNDVIRGTSAGALTLGPSGFTGTHEVQCDILDLGSGSATTTLRGDVSSGGELLITTGTATDTVNINRQATIGPSSGSDEVINVIQGFGDSINDDALRVIQRSTSNSHVAAQFVVGSNTNSTSNKIINFRRGGIGGTGQGAIGFDTGTGVQFTTFSDERLKENFRPAPAQLPGILGLDIQLFDLRNGTASDVFGATAQNIQAHFPDHVSESEDGYFEVGGWGVVELRLAKAIQELEARVAALEAP
jgi:hypothetical protein